MWMAGSLKNDPMPHLIAAPILLPLLTAAIMLMLGEKHRPLEGQDQPVLQPAGAGHCQFCCCNGRRTTGIAGSIGVYLPGNWQAPFGLVLVVDRLSALMLVLTGIIGVYAPCCSPWRAGTAPVRSFHALFQIQLMGLYGAFLTADLFNLFVFFEVLLAASYGLMLHGSGRARVSSGLHYISINLLASTAVPDWRGADLRRHRHPEHGRPGAEDPAGARSRSRPAACRRGHPGRWRSWPRPGCGR